MQYIYAALCGDNEASEKHKKEASLLWPSIEYLISSTWLDHICEG